MDTDQVKQFEQQVFAAIGSSDQISPEDQEQARDSVVPLYHNIEMIEFTISNYDNFESPTSKIFTLNLILFWIKEKYQDLPPECIEGIQQFLFSSNFFSGFRDFPEHLLFLFISSQSQLITKIYPDLWGSFFSDILFTGSSEQDENHDFYVKHFLIVFCKDICTYLPSSYLQIVNLRTNLQQAEITNQIIQYCIEKCQQGDETGYQILENAIDLFPFELFLEGDTMETIFQQGLSNPNTITNTFDALNKIISRNADPPIKLRLLEQYVNPETIFEAIKKSENQEVFISAANLINESLLILQFLDITDSESANNLGSQYLMLNINFIQLNEQTSSQVIYSTYNYMMKHQESASDIAKEVINRLIVNFSEPTVIDNCKYTFKSAEAYSNLIVSSIAIDESIIQQIESYVPSFDMVKNPGVCSMLIYLVLQLLDNRQTKDDFQKRFSDYLEVFVSILNLQPPFSPSQIVCFYMFQWLTSKYKLHFDPSIISSITSIMIQVVMMDGIDESFIDLILPKFPQFDLRSSFKQKIIQVDQECLDAFIQTAKGKFVSVASNLVQCLDADEKAAANQKYVEFFAQAILENDENDENKMNIYVSALSYISGIYFDTNFIEGVPRIDELCEQIVNNSLSNQNVLQNSETLSALIKAMPMVSINLALQAYQNIFQYCKDGYSIFCICTKLIKHMKLNDIDWVPELLGSLFDEIDRLINEYIVESNFGIKKTNMEALIRAFFLLVQQYLDSISKKEWIDFIAQIVQNVMHMIHRLIDIFYESPAINKICIHLLKYFIDERSHNWNQEFVQSLIQEMKSFIPSSLNIIFNHQVEYLYNPWKDVINQIYLFHSKLVQALGDDGSCLDEQFQKFGAPPTFIQRYKQISDLPDKEESQCLFYHDLSICFHGNST